MTRGEIPTGYIFLPGLVILVFALFVILLVFLEHWGVIPS